MKDVIFGMILILSLMVISGLGNHFIDGIF